MSVFDVQYLLLDILSGCDAQISERLPAGTGRINEHFIVYYLIKLTLLGYKTFETSSKILCFILIKGVQIFISGYVD